MATKDEVLKKLDALNQYEQLTSLLDKEQDRVIEAEHVGDEHDQIDKLRQQIAKKS